MSSKKQERQAVTHGAGLQLKENQTRPYCTKHGLHHGQKYQSCRGFAKESTPSKPDFHAKPFKLKEIGLDETVLAEPNLLYCSYEDVLVEREHYQKEILELKLKAIGEYNELTEQKDDLFDRAEAAEKETIRLNGLLMTADGVKETLAKRAEKAEARVQKLEAELKRERNWSKYETKQVKARDKTIKAVVGEKTK